MKASDESMLMKQTSYRDPEELHARLSRWFTDLLGPASNPRLSHLRTPGKAGMSSETLLFDMTWQAQGKSCSGSFVARLPPPADAFPIFPRYDFDLQVQVMRLVGRNSPVPVPQIPWQERDTQALGAPFFIMEKIEGDMVPDSPLYVFGGWLLEATAAEQQQVQQALVGILAAIHGIRLPPEETAFLAIDQPGDTPLRRHFAREKALYEWGRSGMRFTQIEQLFEWLEARWPQSESDPVIIWGDARPANVLWRNCHASAVLDWELAALGPREMDVGYLIFFHRYFHHVAKVMADLDAMPEFLRRDDVVAAYEQMTGVGLHDIDWFIAYGLLQQAVVEVRLSQRRILFGEMAPPADIGEYIYCRGLIQQVLDGQVNLWA